MNDAEVKYWKEQLVYADMTWHEAGLLENPTSTSDRPVGVVPVSEYIKDYRGDQQPPMENAVDVGEQFIGNLTFALTNTMIASISGRDPEVILQPKGETLAQEGAWRRSRINQVLIQSQIREARYKREVDRMLHCAFLSPFGVVRHGYTPSVDEYADDDGNIFARFKNNKPDFPWIRFYRPWDIRIDPMVNSFDPDAEPRWCAFRDIYFERDLRKLARNPGIHFRQDLIPTFSREPDDSYTRSPDMHSSPELSDLYEVWTIYDASERKWFSLSPGSAKTIRDPDDWPLEWGQLPYTALTLNEQIDSPFGVPFPKMYAHEQSLYNKVWTIISAVVSRTRRVVFVNKEQFEADSEQLNNLLTMESMAEFIGVTGDPATVVREVALGTIDPQLIGLLYQLRESIREVLGVSNFDRGQRANVETASEANQIGQGADLQRSRSQSKLEIAWTEIARVSHRALMQVQDVRGFVIPIVGEENAAFLTESEAEQGFIKATPAQLSGEYDYSVKVNSTLPLNNAEDYAKGASLFQLLKGGEESTIQIHAAATDLANWAGVDTERWITPQQQMQKLAEMENQQGATPQQGGGGGGDPLSALLNAQGRQQ